MVMGELAAEELNVEACFYVGALCVDEAAVRITLQLTSSYGAAYFIEDSVGAVWFSSHPGNKSQIAVRVHEASEPYWLVLACLTALADEHSRQQIWLDE
jgi:hypothetical protein